MKKYKGFTKKELVTILAEEKAKQVKKELELKGEQWDFGDGFQRTNTLVKTWKNLYNTYPIISKTMPMFSLSKLYDEMIENKK